MTRQTKKGNDAETERNRPIMGKYRVVENLLYFLLAGVN